MPDRAWRLAVLLLAAVILGTALVSIAGCGDGKSGALSQEQYGRMQKGMTLDEIEAIGGQPYRTHKTGTSQDPNVVWYYSKTEGEGLVRVSFLGGKVDSLSPYDISIQPEE